MYKINIYNGELVDPHGYLLLSETIYTNGTYVEKAQLWVNGIRDTDGVLTRHNLFKIFYKDGHSADVEWKNYDPIYYRSEICISFDGENLYIPDYSRGIFVINIRKKLIVFRYNIKHIISMLITDSSLLCLHRESNRELIRIDLEKEQQAESQRAIGSHLIPLTGRCIIFRESESHYIIADANNLQKRVKVSSRDLLGYYDKSLDIYKASYFSGCMDIDYYIADVKNPQYVISNHQRLLCPEKVRQFIASMC